MEIIDLDVKAYKKQSPYRTVFSFILGVLVGIALFYMYLQFNPPPKETPPPIPPTSPTAEVPREKAPKPAEQTQVNEEQKLLAELETISPFIYIVNENKFSDSTIDMLNQIRPFAIVVKPDQGSSDKDKFLNLLQNIRDRVRSNVPDLPLLAMDLDFHFLQSLPEFQQLPKLTDFNTSTDIIKITDAGNLYAQKIREWGISMLFGPMIEIYVTGRVPEIEKGNYIGDTTEAIQWIGLSFSQGIWQGKVAPVIKSFPSKTLAGKKEVDGKVCFALEVDKAGEDMNQAISQLATWLFPFSEAVYQNLPALLVSHVSIPLLDDENPYLPATVSQKIIYGLIRGKWGYDGIIIADDIAEYPLNGTTSYSDVALQMIGVGIDLICSSLEDAIEMTKMVTMIEQNISREAKEKRCMRLARLMSAVCPLPKKEKQEMAPSVEPVLTAQQSQTSSPVIETSTPPSSEKSPVETTETSSASHQEPIAPPTEIETTQAETTTESTPVDSNVTLSPNTQPTETSIAQDLTQIATEKKEETVKTAMEPPKEDVEPEEQKSAPSKEITEIKSIEKAPQPPGTKEIKHKIVRGETLYNIAQKYQVKPKDLMAWNGIQDPNLIKYGLHLVVYVPQGIEVKQQPEKTITTQEKTKTPPAEKPAPITLPEVENKASTTDTQTTPATTTTEEKTNSGETVPQESSSPSSPTGETIIYTVKYGDTLDSIARDMRVTKEEIIQLNNLKKPYLLPAGRKLKVPRVPKIGFN
ncbi:MAG: LysM peptidoglycan-binding domain-containing protein [Candidatus Hydrogenedens sp.]